MSEARAGDAIASPCTNVCKMNASTGLCLGCWRTIDEITAWARLDDDAKRHIWLQLEQRRAGAKEKRA